MEEIEDKGKVLSSSQSQSVTDDIPRLSEPRPSIEEHTTPMRAYRVQVLPLPPYRPSQPLSQIPLLPVAVLTFILSLIPQTSVLKFALLSRDFLSAAQTVLYGNLDMQDVRNSDVLWIFFVTSLTHVLYVPAWPFAQTPAYLIPCVLSRMDNLRFITLPSFDLHIVRHHSAFGLRHIEHGNTRPSGQAEIKRLTWLDGQTNAVSFRIPFLLDDDRRLCHFRPHLRIPTFSPRPPRQANHSRPDEHCLSPIFITPRRQ